MSLQHTIISFWEAYILIVKNHAHISKEVHRVRKWSSFHSLGIFEMGVKYFKDNV